MWIDEEMRVNNKSDIRNEENMYEIMKEESRMSLK
jgi:hypothetical protein